MLAGISGMAWLLPQARTVGAVTFDVHTLYYAALATVIGYQSLQFWLFATAYGMNEGLLRLDAGFRRLIGLFSVEVGVIGGVLLILIGLALGVYAVETWKVLGFGELMPSRTLRYVICSGTAILIGLQTIYGAFFMSLLAIRGARN